MEKSILKPLIYTPLKMYSSLGPKVNFGKKILIFLMYTNQVSQRTMSDNSLKHFYNIAVVQSREVRLLYVLNINLRHLNFQQQLVSVDLTGFYGHLN